MSTAAPATRIAIDRSAQEPLLRVRDLNVEFQSERGRVGAVRDSSFDVYPGEAVAVLGESGSGKSVTSRAIMGLLPEPPASVTGSILFDGVELVGASERRLRDFRGRGVGMVFQDSLDALNPAFTVGSQLTEIFRVRMGASRRESTARATELMEAVGIPNGAERLRDYPHQFSGGMRQRICIAMAIALQPKLLIADEPTTALDVTVQAGILRLLSELQRSIGMSMIFITHDISVARLVADRIIVMYAGRIMEAGAADEVSTRPANPYTRALLLSQPGAVDNWRKLRPIGGSPPDKAAGSIGCPFVSRCPVTEAVCRTDYPPFERVSATHRSLCHFASEVQHGER